MNNIKAEDFAEENKQFTIKFKCSTLGAIIETSRQEPLISFLLDDNIRDLLGSNRDTLYEKYHLYPNPDDIMSFDKILLETVFAQKKDFKGKNTNRIHVWTVTVDPGYKYPENTWGGIHCYILESKDCLQIISFKLENETGNLVPFNGQRVTFRLSIKEDDFFWTNFCPINDEDINKITTQPEI